MSDPFDILRTSRPSDDPFDVLRVERAPLISRVGTAVKEMVTHPWETVKGMVTAPLHAAKTGAEFIGQSAAEMSLPDDVRGYALNDPERVSERDALISAAQLAVFPAMRVLTPLARAMSPALAGAAGASSRVTPALAARLAANSALGAGAGVAYAPDDPAVGAILGAAGGGAIPEIPRVVRRLRPAPPAPVPTPARAPSPLRVPASEAEARLAQAAKPQEVDAPVSTGAAREAIANLESIIEPNRVKPAEVAPASPDAFPEGFTASGSRVRRVPAAEAESRLAQIVRAAKEDAPVSTGDARAAIAQVDEILAANRVQPTAAFPRATEAFPEGFSTPSSRVRRRPGGIAPSADPFDVLRTEAVPEPKSAPVAPPEPTPTIAEPVSFGRDLAEPGRIPGDAPKVPRPQGAEPSGVVETPEGAVSAGPRTIPGAPKTLSPVGPRNVTAEQMLEVGKQRAAELEGGRTPGLPPDLDPAMHRTGLQFAEPVIIPESRGTAGPSQALTAIEGTGEVQTRGLSAGVAQKAVANKLTESLGDLPEFRTINMVDQAAKASKLLAENPELAHRVARGEAPPPADLLPESVFVAVENRAIANGDVGTLRALASGELTEQATTMGQRIRALGERNPESPVAAMQKIVEARTKGIKNAKVATEATVQDLQRHIAEAAKMDPPAWTKFIDSLRC